MAERSSNHPKIPAIRLPTMRQNRGHDVQIGDPSDLAAFVQSHSPLLVLTGAGLSTGSGIPAYRGPDGRWLRRTPIFYQDFMTCPKARRRYWARSFMGWRHVSEAEPNRGHRVLADLEKKQRIQSLITQNVDGLHQAAGSSSVIELHGRLASVRCLDCDLEIHRDEVQSRLSDSNQSWSAQVMRLNPDGDVDLRDTAYDDFMAVDCDHCGGILKPDVVFFGESVPKTKLHAIHDALKRAKGVLVIGSSLVVMSGYRIVRDAHQMGLSIASINDGQTRADPLLRFKVSGDCIEVLNNLSQTMGLS